MIVPFSPGGGADIIARTVALKLTEAWSTQVIVDNRPAAAGIVAFELVARAAPDGYTLVMGQLGTVVLNPILHAKLPYETLRDFAPVSLTASVANVLAVHPSLPARSVQALLVLARARPGALNYGTNGIGPGTLLFKHLAKIDIVQIPYKGTLPMVNDLIAGNISMTIVGIPTALTFVRTGRLRALAVTPNQRQPTVPELPTIAESGVPGYNYTPWFGLLAPAATPKNIIAKVNADTVAGMAHPDVVKRLAGEGAQPAGSTPAQFDALIRRESEYWTKVIKASGATHAATAE
jgi:tripartite-type tricarboxylate transporter receptor subunit TctC